MTIRRDAGKWLQKKAKTGRGQPIGTIAFYGPDQRCATKVVAAVLRSPDEDPTDLRRWLTADRDLRRDGDTLGEITSFFKSHGVRSVAMIDRIIGCPHEEGIDYPVGEPCPACPYWAKRDRWTGELET